MRSFTFIFIYVVCFLTLIVGCVISGLVAVSSAFLGNYFLAAGGALAFCLSVALIIYGYEWMANN